MTHLCTLIEFVQNLCLEDETVNIMLKEIDEMSRENAQLENQLEECDREHVRLQIHYHNLKIITSFIDISAINNLKHTSRQIYSECNELQNLITNIDFTKILKCYHMEIDAKCRKEWQPIQDCFARTLEWHKKMEQRHIVQKYRQTEIAYRAVEEDNRNQRKSMEVSLKQSLELINQAKDRRNNLVLNLIKGSKELNAFETKMMKLNQYGIYIEGLKQEKEKLARQLDQKYLKAFNPTISLHNNHNFAAASKPSAEASNFIMPKLPSFADILRSFNQTEKQRNVTSIENTTNICVKSILTTTKKSITTKQTKSVHFKMELETESENDIEVEGQPEASLDINEHREENDNLQEVKDLENVSNVQIVDLLTPAESFTETVKENQKVMPSSDETTNSKYQNDKKPLIQDCIIFKTPFPVEEVLNMQYKETVTNSIKASCSQKTNQTSGSSSHSDIAKILNTTKKSFYEEFLVSSSDEPSTQTNETSSNFMANTANLPEMSEFFDFDCNKGFSFDSDDNMTDNYSRTGNMDFM